MISFRQCEIIIYDKVKKYTKEEIKRVLDSKQSIIDYRFIYHDKDTYSQEDINYLQVQIDNGATNIKLPIIGAKKDNHYHIMIKLGAPTPCDNISKWFDVPSNNVNKLKIRDYYIACGYLVHYKQVGKYQYGVEEVISKNNDFKTLDASSDKPIEEVEELFYCYGRCELSKRDLFNKISEKDFHKYSRLFNDMVKYRQLKVRDRDMKVIYITGESGSGKTTLAKYMARSLHYDYFVSGSGKDVLDGYDKEECIILDDLRADSFTKSELFKLLDNNTNSSVKSRYANKDISYCKLLIITSIKTPYNLYDWSTRDNENTGETFKQLARRLKFVFVNIDNETSIIQNLRLVESDKSYCGYISQYMSDAPFTMEQVYTALSIIKSVSSPTSSIFQACKDCLDKEEQRQLKEVQEIANEYF